MMSKKPSTRKRKRNEDRMATKTLDFNIIRYLNLFEKITKVRTDSFFIFNGIMFFAVPSEFISRAVGERGSNVKELSEILGKRVKIVGLAKSSEAKDINQFMQEVISPVQAKTIEVTEKEIIINPGKMNKAMLIGRDKQKLKELQKIAQEFFGKELKIV